MGKDNILVLGIIGAAILLILIGVVFNIVSTKIPTNNVVGEIVTCEAAKKSGDNGRRTGEILILIGYSFVIISMLLLISLRVVNIMVPLLVLILIIYKTAVTGIFFNKLVRDDIANEYFVYEGLSKFLLLGQLILIVLFLVGTKGKANKQIGSSDNSDQQIILTTIGLSLVNIALTGITNVILVFFSTDG
jgi:hypothetical protein